MVDGSISIDELKRRVITAESRASAAEAALREGDARHRLLIESWAQAMWETDADGVVVSDSPSWRAYTGQTLEEWLGYGWLDAIHPDDRVYAERQWREAVSARGRVNAEFRLRAPDGGWRWTNVLAAPLLAADGTIEKWLGLNLDIDDRKQAEAELRESEERQAYFLALSDALRPLADQEDIQAEAMRLLGEKLSLNRAQYYIADETGEYLSSSGGYSNGIPAAIGRFHLIEFGKYAFDGFHAGETQVVCDATTDPRINEAVLRSYKTVGFLAYIGVPFVQRGKLVGTLAVHQSEPRQWTVSERMMVEETAQRAGIAVEQARAESALRESQQRKAFLLKLSDALRAAPDAEAVGIAATRMMAEELGTDRCWISRMSYEEDLTRAGPEYRKPGLPSFIGTYPLSGYPNAKRAAETGTLIYHDVQNQPELSDVDKRSMGERGIAAALSAALHKGERRYIWSLVVAMSSPRHWTRSEIALVEEAAERVWAAEERAKSEAALRDSEERFRQFANASSGAIWIRNARTLVMEYVSPAIERIYGVSQEAFLGDMSRWAAMIVPEDRDVALSHIEQARRGEPAVHEFRIQRPSDRVFRWIRNIDFPLYDAQGNIERIGGIAEDVTEEKLLTEHQGVLLAELQHRVRNIMAVLRSIASRTSTSATSVEDYAELMVGRLNTFARVQALLTRAANAGVGMSTIVHDELSALAAHTDQFDVDGPDVELSPKAAETMTLAVHELTTNALKYGGLSVPDGKVRVHWNIVDRQDAPWLSFDWSESGAPPQPPSDKPRRIGFGSELIEGRIPYELSGRGKVTLTEGGAQCHLEFPLKHGASILETSAPPRATVFGGAIDMTGQADLTGQRILVVEDDYYLASDTARALQGAGAEVLGPCATEDAARIEIAEVMPTAAVLDINLRGGRSFNLAGDFKRDGVPFVFITGYDQEVIPERFQHVTRLQKPVEFRHVIDALAESLGI